MLSITEFSVLLLSVLTVYFFARKRRLSKPPILNIYRRPDVYYYPKLWFMYAVTLLRRRATEKTDLSALEGFQKLHNSKRAVDAVFFNGGNENGDYFVCGMARRPSKLIDGLLYLKVNQLGLLGGLPLPSTSLQQSSTETGYCAGGVEVTNVTPLKEWKITYKGELKVLKDGSDQKVAAFVDLRFKSSLPCFSFEDDVHPFSIASAVAKEKWSRDYFNLLKEMHQHHYEQPGTLEGTVTIDGEVFPVHLDALRDHTVGTREWRNFHRYILHWFTTENGDSFSVLLISWPICFSTFHCGFVYSAGEKKMVAMEACDLQLYQHGELGGPVEDYGFSIKAGGKNYTVLVNVVEKPAFYISKDWECKVYECMCRFEVNGLKGWGFAEWEYRNVDGKGVAK